MRGWLKSGLCFFWMKPISSGSLNLEESIFFSFFYFLLKKWKNLEMIKKLMFTLMLGGTMYDTWIGSGIYM